MKRAAYSVPRAPFCFLVAAAGCTVTFKSSNQTVEQHCHLSFANKTANSLQGIPDLVKRERKKARVGE